MVIENLHDRHKQKFLKGHDMELSALTVLNTGARFNNPNMRLHRVWVGWNLDPKTSSHSAGLRIPTS